MLDSVLMLSFKDFAALLIGAAFGLLWHYVAKIIELRKTNHGLTFRRYYLDHKPEALASVLAVLAGIYGLIEVGQATVFNVILLAYTVDSHANKFRNRSGQLLQ